jgi:hypothetical protein
MSILYSLRVRPAWAPSFSPQWTDVTDTLIVDQLPSISINSERADIPLLAVASDLSITVLNADNRWDALLDSTKIVGPLPPTSGAQLRSPLVNYGRVLLCRKSTEQTQWEVLFFGYIDQHGVRFNRLEKLVTFTAYSPQKLLEQGNAERVQRLKSIVVARPFTLTGYGLVHPTVSPGQTQEDNSWWLIPNGAAIPLQAGDDFRIVRFVSTWSENMQTIPIVNTTLTIVQVQPHNNDLFIQTTDSPAQPVINGPAQATVEVMTPWYRSRGWEQLVLDLVAEANTALGLLGSQDSLTVDVTNLPLLQGSSQLFAQLINMSDVVVPVTGIAYGQFGPAAPKGLFYSTESAPTAQGVAAEKPDILGPRTLNTATPVFQPGTILSGYQAAPDDGQTSRVFPTQPDFANLAPDFATNDIVFVGKDIHTFNIGRIGDAAPGMLLSDQYWRTTRWCRTPTSLFAGPGVPKRHYRLYAYQVPVSGTTGAFLSGIQITELLSSNSGTNWTMGSNARDDIVVNPRGGSQYGSLEPPIGSAARADIKVVEVNPGSFLYCWWNPLKNFSSEAYVKASSTDSQAATYMIPPPASFVDSTRPASGGSGFVYEAVTNFGNDGRNLFFFCEVQGKIGVDLYWWNGSAMVKGSIVDNTGLGISLIGGDFGNAIIQLTDPNGPPKRFYVMVGNTLFSLVYTFDSVGGTMTFTSGQIVVIDSPNYDQYTEDNAHQVNNPMALAWIAGRVFQANPGEPNYSTAAEAQLVGTLTNIYIVSTVATNIVDYADYEGQSTAAALADMIVIRGYQMMAGADQDFVANPASYDPIAKVTFRPRLLIAPVPIDMSQWTEACEDGLWILNYTSIGVKNSKLSIGPYYNYAALTTPNGIQYSIKPPRFPGSASFVIDSPLISTASFCQLLANYYAQDFLVPQPDATIVVRDPYVVGLGSKFNLLDLVTYLVRSPDSNSGTIVRQGRIFTIDYQLDLALLTLKVQ